MPGLDWLRIFAVLHIFLFRFNLSASGRLELMVTGGLEGTRRRSLFLRGSSSSFPKMFLLASDDSLPPFLFLPLTGQFNPSLLTHTLLTQTQTPPLLNNPHRNLKLSNFPSSSVWLLFIDQLVRSLWLFETENAYWYFQYLTSCEWVVNV